MTSSGVLPISKRRPSLGVALALAALGGLFAAWLYQRGYLLYYGDAAAHLNISRSLIDSQSPGYEQLGTVWLPVLHLLCLPFVATNSWWHSGLAGTFPVLLCFVIAGTFFLRASGFLFQSAAASLTMLLCLALNPNLLYLSSIPMTETVFLAGLAVCLWALLAYREKNKRLYIAAAILASWWMSLTRYDGWFLIPFLCAALAYGSRQRRLMVFFVAGTLCALAPAYWMAHNWWETSNALDFANGPYSASAIQGDKPYPGLHNWPQALQYYGTAGVLCAGSFLAIVGGLGTFAALSRRRLRPLFFLALTPAFYVWSLHSSRTPIFVPSLWPFGYYNTRYGIALLVLCAFAAGAFIDCLPARARTVAAGLVVFCSVGPWQWRDQPDGWICWKESERNSVARRAWTKVAADFLRGHYAAGDGVLASFGDQTGIFREAEIPLRETLHEGNGPLWMAAVSAPSVYHPQRWAIALSGDRVSKALSGPSPYELVLAVKQKNERTLEIYRRK